jgi:hypothetical protein
MLRSLGIGRLLSFAVLAMVLLAVWKANNGDLSSIAAAIWEVLNRGADVVTTLWDSFVSSGKAESAVSSIASDA